jgi:hypothetical protein
MPLIVVPTEGVIFGGVSSETWGVIFTIFDCFEYIEYVDFRLIVQNLRQSIERLPDQI